MGEYDEKFTTPKDDIETSSGELKELINPEKQYKYYVGGHIGLNMQIPQTDIYDNYSEAISKFGHQSFIKVSYEDNIIKDMYLGFVKDGKLFYLKGYIKERGLTEKPTFEFNKKVLIEAFGYDKCYMSDDQFHCKDEARGLFGRVDYNGWLQYGEEFEYTFFTGKGCIVNAGGHSWCSR